MFILQYYLLFSIIENASHIFNMLPFYIGNEGEEKALVG